MKSNLLWTNELQRWSYFHRFWPPEYVEGDFKNGWYIIYKQIIIPVNHELDKAYIYCSALL